MTRPVEQLYEQASLLSVEERAELAGRLLENLDDSREEGVEEAWAAEIERRMNEYRAGRAKSISWSELRAHLHRAGR